MVASTFFLRAIPESKNIPGIVIISTSPVATIIHAVSAALISAMRQGRRRQTCELNCKRNESRCTKSTCPH